MRPSGISDPEWQARQDLAACYRLLALACGRSIPEAFIEMNYLERACQAQVAALGGGAKVRVLPAAVAAQTARQFDTARERRKTADGRTYTLEWAALTRMLDQADTSWRD